MGFNPGIIAKAAAVAGFVGAVTIGSAVADSHQTVVEIAAGSDDHTTLVAAVEAAGLVETLSGEGPFTVFAPTNDAFAALPEGTVDTLLMEENKDQLTGVLTYHVVPAKAMAADVSKMIMDAGGLIALNRIQPQSPIPSPKVKAA